MFDSLGIAFGDRGIEPEAQEEAQHDLVPPPAFPGQRPALVRQKD